MSSLLISLFVLSACGFVAAWITGAILDGSGHANGAKWAFGVRKALGIIAIVFLVLAIIGWLVGGGLNVAPASPAQLGYDCTEPNGYASDKVPFKGGTYRTCTWDAEKSSYGWDVTSDAPATQPEAKPADAPAPAAADNGANTGDFWDTGNCPTNRSVAEQLDIPVDTVVASHGGVDAPWEGCKWQIQQPAAMLLNSDFTFTTRHPDKTIWVEKSDGSRLKVIGGTIRWNYSYQNPSRQWMLDPKKLLLGEDETGQTSGEWHYGQSQDPAYPTCPAASLGIELTGEIASQCANQK